MGRRRLARGLLPGLLAAASVPALVLGGASPAPAAADEHPAVTVTEPVEGAAAAGVLDVAFEVDARDVDFDRVRSWSVEILRSGESRGVLCRRDYGDDGPRRVTVTLSWDTGWYPGGDDPPAGCEDAEALPGEERQSRAPSRNGAHTIRVVATSTGTVVREPGTGDAERTVHVGNAPAAPTGVETGFDDESGAVEISWDANPEPDLAGYRVAECRRDAGSEDPCEDGDWTTVATVGPDVLTATAAVEEAGEYRYRVAADRPGPTPDAPDLSTWSPPTSALVLAVEPEEGSTTTSRPTSTTTTEPATTSTTSTTGPGTTTSTGAGGDPGGGGDPAPASPSNLRVVRRPPPTTTTTADPGYERVLPYETGATSSTTSAPPPTAGMATASFDGEGRDGDLALAAPLAGAMLAFVLAMQLRHASRRSDAVAPPG